jgi:glycine dehydrogenase subunit 1
MRYLPHTREDIAAMLEVVGAQRLDDLFSTVPDDCCSLADLNLGEPMSEWDLNEHMNRLADTMAVAPHYNIFLGAGSYDHFIPEALQHLLLRSEFFTAYTPYQPEISQGTLQTIFEYQTLIARLLGMDVANASLYDGASALAEALLMAVRITKRKKVALASAVHPLYRRVVKTYFAASGYEVVELPYGRDGRTDPAALPAPDQLAGVAVQSPNFFGCIEDLAAVGNAIHADPKTLFIAAFSEPLAYGLLKNPGSLGADIVCGEGQSLGIPRSFGGPGLGVFAVQKKYVRSMPGRVVGQTVDKEGKRGFVLTLSTREQHIRRERATSNICSNQGLCAVAATMYMAFLGGTGFRELARLNRDKSEYLKRELLRVGCRIPFDTPTFNEFVVQFPDGADKTCRRLLKKKIVAGLPLGPYYPELADCALVCATETSRKADMDALVEEVTS